MWNAEWILFLLLLFPTALACSWGNFLASAHLQCHYTVMLLT